MDLRQATRLGLLVGLWVSAAMWAWGQDWTGTWGLGADAHAYWMTGHRPELYGPLPSHIDAYNYSPAFAQLIHPLTLLPAGVFEWLFVGTEAVLFAWLLWPLGWRLGVPLWLFCAPEIMYGNIVGWLAVALVFGVRRWPGLWALPLLTKVAPGVLGVLWFAVRGEWRRAGWAVGWTVALAALSVAVWPSAWAAWFEFLRAAPSGGWALLRAVIAAALVVVGARRGWLWMLPLGMLLASPVVSISTVPLLAAIPRLLRLERRGQEGPGLEVAEVGHDVVGVEADIGAQR